MRETRGSRFHFGTHPGWARSTCTSSFPMLRRWRRLVCVCVFFLLVFFHSQCFERAVVFRQMRATSVVRVGLSVGPRACLFFQNDNRSAVSVERSLSTVCRGASFTARSLRDVQLDVERGPPAPPLKKVSLSLSLTHLCVCVLVVISGVGPFTGARSASCRARNTPIIVAKSERQGGRA